MKKIIETVQMVRGLAREMENVRLALGRIEARQCSALPENAALANREFQVYSQWGEDGILHYLLESTETPRKIFVEFGVENYREANTRFLLQHRGWAGLVIDGSAENIGKIRQDPIYWKYSLKAEHSFVDRDSINPILKKHGLTGEIGLLSVDIDGNDYWIWEAIEQVDPVIVISEYNAIFGSSAAVTVPYDAKFQRGNAHHSHLYFGASLAALEQLGKRKGYSLVGTNSNGCNAFFVKTNKLGRIKPLRADAAFHPATFRESRDASGALSFLSVEDGRALIGSLPVVDLQDGKTKAIRELF